MQLVAGKKRSEYSQTVINAQSFTKAVGPTLPSHGLYCVGTSAGDDHEQADNQYVQSFEEPYRDVISPLLGATRSLAPLDPSFDESQAIELSLKIACMADQQAASLITHYQSGTRRTTSPR